MKLKRYETADDRMHLFYETSDRTETGFYSTVEADFPDESIRKIERLLGSIYRIVKQSLQTHQMKVWNSMSEEKRAICLESLKRGRQVSKQARLQKTTV